MKKKIILSIALLSGIAVKSYAQTAIKKAEIALQKAYEEIPEQQDSTYFYANKFRKELIALIKNNPATINYDFKLLHDSSHCYITTATDGNFRIYSWDTWTGGTMHFFNAVYQYRTAGKVSTQIPVYKEGDPGAFCSKIYTVTIKDKVYYLAISNGIYSTKESSQSVQAFTITDGKLDDTARIFKTKTKLLNRIDVSFDFFSVVDRPERPLELITYNEATQEVHIPLVDKKDQVTNSNLVYRLTGDCFEYVGVVKSK